MKMDIVGRHRSKYECWSLNWVRSAGASTALPVILGASSQIRFGGLTNFLGRRFYRRDLSRGRRGGVDCGCGCGRVGFFHKNRHSTANLSLFQEECFGSWKHDGHLKTSSNRQPKL